MDFLGKSLIASSIVFLTTADDALWLVPFVTSPSLSSRSKWIHALIFIFTVQFIVLISIFLVYVFGSIVDESNNERYLPYIAAIVTWMIALKLYIDKIRKRRRKQKQKQMKQMEQKQEELSTTRENHYYHAITNDTRNENEIETTTLKGDNHREDDVDVVVDVDLENQNGTRRFQPFTVCSLTFLGGLDELTYFPTLIIGKTFTFYQLSFGALLACFFILIVITTILSKCRPVLEWMDSIPLYVIISIFALFLTVEAIIGE